MNSMASYGEAIWSKGGFTSESGFSLAVSQLGV